MPSIAYTVSNQRAELGFTQQELAELSGVSIRLIRELEAGRANPGMLQLIRIAKALNLTLTLVPATI